MTTEEALEVNCQLAMARLGVAEELRKVISVLAAWLAYVYSESWLAVVGVFLASELIVPYWYSKQYDAAWDVYARATNTGKYNRPNVPESPD